MSAPGEPVSSEQQRQPKPEAEQEAGESSLDQLLGPLNRVLEPLANSAARNPTLSALLIVVIVPSFVVVIGAAVLREMPPLSFAVATYLSTAPIALVLAYVFAQTQRVNPRIGRTGNTFRLGEKLTEIDRQDIKDALAKAAEQAAAAFGLSSGQVRASLFGLDGNRRLRMIPGLRVGEYTKDEPTVQIRVGEGVVGHCFAAGSPLIVQLDRGAAGYWLEEKEQRKLHPNLSWVVAMPVASDGRPMWVISVSGLQPLGKEREVARVLEDLSRLSRMLCKTADQAVAAS